MNSLPITSSKKRFVSLVLPHFAIENQRLLRSKQKPLDEPQTDISKRAPFALVANTGQRQRLRAIDDTAHQQGLIPGMALSDALALCPLLQTKKAVPQKDARKLLQLARWCERYSPLSNVYDDISLWINVTGTAHLFGGEKSLLETIQTDFQQLGYTVKLALASTFSAAFALAHFHQKGKPSIGITSSTRLQQALYTLPVSLLRLEDEIISTLHRLGLMTIGQLTNLPRDSLKRRFSSREQHQSVLLRLDQIYGLREEPLSPLTSPAIFSCRLRFAEALFSRQMLEHALARLIRKITKQLEQQKQGARQLVFTMWRSDGSRAYIKIGTSSPCRDEPHILKLFQEKLNQVEPGFGVDILALFVDKSEPLAETQTSLDRGKTSTSLSPTLLIDHLQNRLGAQKIGYLHALASHIPECAQTLTNAPSAKRTWPAPTPTENAAPAIALSERPFLLLDPPEPIEVMAALPNDPPLLFIWRRVRRKVIASTGPERLTPEWWHELDGQPSPPRDYYKVKTDKGTSFWLYRDGLHEEKNITTNPSQWFMHGFF